MYFSDRTHLSASRTASCLRWPWTKGLVLNDHIGPTGSALLSFWRKSEQKRTYQGPQSYFESGEETLFYITESREFRVYYFIDIVFSSISHFL